MKRRWVRVFAGLSALGLVIGCGARSERAVVRTRSTVAARSIAAPVTEPGAARIGEFASAIASSPYVASLDYMYIPSSATDAVRLFGAKGEVSGVVTGVSSVEPLRRSLAVAQEGTDGEFWVNELAVGLRIRTSGVAGAAAAGIASGSEVVVAIPVWTGKPGPMQSDAATKLIPSITSAIPVGAQIVCFVSGQNPDASLIATSAYTCVLGRSDGTGLTTLGPSGPTGTVWKLGSVAQISTAAAAAVGG